MVRVERLIIFLILCILFQPNASRAQVCDQSVTCTVTGPPTWKYTFHSWGSMFHPDPQGFWITSNCAMTAKAPAEFYAMGSGSSEVYFATYDDTYCGFDYCCFEITATGPFIGNGMVTWTTYPGWDTGSVPGPRDFTPPTPTPYPIVYGKYKWSFYFSPTWRAEAPALGTDGTIYCGSRSTNDFYALNPDKTIKWKYDAEGKIITSPSVGNDGTIYFGIGNCFIDVSVVALHPDGSLKWKFESDSDLMTDLALSRGGETIYCHTGSELYALTSDSTIKWVIDDIYTFISTPVIGHDGVLYIHAYLKSTSDYVFLAINPDGSIKWSIITGHRVSTPPALNNDGTIYFCSSDNKLYALRSDGSKIWEFDAGSPLSYSPAIGKDNTIYIGSSGGSLCAISPSGTMLWEFDPGDPVRCHPSVGKNNLIYVTAGNFIYAVNPDGTEYWRDKHAAVADGASPLIAQDGSIYTIAFDTLYAFESDSLGLADSAWPMCNHDGQRTGQADSLIIKFVSAVNFKILFIFFTFVFFAVILRRCLC